MAGDTMHKLTYKKKVSLSLITGAKIAKGERRGKRKTKFFKFGSAGPHPVLTIVQGYGKEKGMYFPIWKYIPLSFFNRRFPSICRVDDFHAFA
jgi:hypothetical protein